MPYFYVCTRAIRSSADRGYAAMGLSLYFNFSCKWCYRSKFQLSFTRVALQDYANINNINTKRLSVNNVNKTANVTRLYIFLLLLLDANKQTLFATISSIFFHLSSVHVIHPKLNRINFNYIFSSVIFITQRITVHRNWNYYKIHILPAIRSNV